MAKRQLARKKPDTGGPNLRLVSPPKPKPRTRRWKLPRSMRGFRWSYKRAVWLHAHEDRVVTQTLIERGGTGSAAGWTMQEPGRWNHRLLDKTFKRLSAKGYVHAIGTRHFTLRRRAMTYELTDLGRDAYEKGRV